MADRRTDTGPHRRIRTGCTWVASLLALVGVFGLSAARGQAVSGPVLAPPAGAAPGPAKAGAPSVAKPTEMVMDVQIRGNKSVPLDKILPQIRTRKNRPYDAELIQEDVRRLDRTHLFVDVKPSYQQVPGGRIVIFEVVERPLLKEIKFVGSKEISKKVLQKESKLKEGDALDPFAIEEARRTLEELYHSRGYNRARVTLLEGNKPEDRNAIFLINEGVRQRVSWVSFVGNTIADDARLRTQIKTAHPFLWLFKGEFDRKQLDEDRDRLIAYYRGLGFFQARIGVVPDDNETGDWIRVTFVIDEGPRFKIRNVSVQGNTKYTNDELMADLKLKKDDYFNQAKLESDRHMMADKYGSVGYVFAEIKPDPRFLEQMGQLDLIYNVKEGDRYRVGKIAVKINGENPHTQITTVLNRLSFQPGDIVDIRELRASERRLRYSQLFEANPAQGKAPKIEPVLAGRDDQDDEDEAKKPAEDKGSRRRGGRGMGRGMGSGDTASDGGSTFRGQSPDSPSVDRKLDVIVDCSECGRFIGPTDPENAAPRAKAQGGNRGNDQGSAAPGRLQANAPRVAQAACPSASSARADELPAAPGARLLTDEAKALTLTLSQRERGQSDETFSQRERGQSDETGSQGERAQYGDLSQKARELTDALSQTRREQQLRDRLFPTQQYVPDAGQADPAAQRPALRWTSVAPAAAGTANAPTTANAAPAAAFAPAPPAAFAPAPANPPYFVAQQPQAVAPMPTYSQAAPGQFAPPQAAPVQPGPTYSQAAPGQFTPTQAAPVQPAPAYSQAAPGQFAPPQAAPVQPAPAYGQQMWPRQGPDRPVETPQGQYMPGPIFSEDSPFRGGPAAGDLAQPLGYTVTAEEAMTGRLMFGVGVNSDAGLVGTITLDEQNFDWTRFPNSWEDIRNGTAWRGAGQHLQLQAMPGTQVQRYSASFQEPYLFNTPVALGLSGFYYTRIYNEYTEAELGGRVALGYQFSPDLSGTLAYRGEKINITNPVDPDPLFLPLSEVTGRNLALHQFSVTLTNDKRDNAFMATEGHLIEGSIGEVLGSFAYPQASIDLRKYFTLYERPDGSGRHVLSLAAKAAYTGDNTPIYERFYAGGFSSLRGFQFRGVSPEEYDFITGQEVKVGGDFMLLASAEYLFPITADDMLRGVVFLDTGTVEPKINNWNNNYRVAPGFGLRIVVPAMGPAPIALDFAFPIAWQPGDTHEMFSFFVGFGR